MMLGLMLWAAPVTAETVIAMLGDSLTQGYGLRPDQGLVPQLDAWLGDDVRIINAGVSGDTTAGGLSRIAWTLTPEVDGVIVALGGNDMLRGIDPAVSRANLDAILTAASEAGVPAMLIGMQAGGNYGPDYKTDFDAIYPDLAAEHGLPLIPSFLSALGDAPADAAALLQPDGLHPNPDGVALIVQSIGPQIADWAATLPR